MNVTTPKLKGTTTFCKQVLTAQHVAEIKINNQKILGLCVEFVQQIFTFTDFRKGAGGGGGGRERERELRD